MKDHAMVDGYACWTGPSGTRYASPWSKSIVGILSQSSFMAGVPVAVRRWLLNGELPTKPQPPDESDKPE